MDIHLSDELSESIRKKASDAGLSPDRWVSLALSEQIDADVRASELRSQRIDEWLRHAEASNAQSGREDRPWREFIHEGHAA